MCFIGHGAFGIITKPIWCNYFAVFGIGTTTAYRLMPLVGTADILFGLCLLLRPVPVVALWLVVWGTVTALLRPLSGEPFAEFIERAGNFGAPLALLVLGGGLSAVNFRWLFSPWTPDLSLDEATLGRVKTVLRGTVFLLLAGHGWLNLLQKPGLLHQYAALGFSNPAHVALVAGMVEVLGGLSILVEPLRPVILLLLFWKVGTELLYPSFKAFEWIERGGSYGSLLALWVCLLPSRDADRTSSNTPPVVFTG
jgi:hypothetical protein